MQPDELVVARLSKGATVVRYLGTTKSQVSIALGRNRQARIPPARILLATGVLAAGPEEAEDFGRRSQALADEIDLTEVWEVVGQESESLTVQDLSELLWPDAASPVRLAALAMHLERDTDLFVRENGGYTPRTPDSVAEIVARRSREAENAEAAIVLMQSLSQGVLPAPVTTRQELLLRHLKGYAVHGDDYERGSVARSLLQNVPDVSGDLHRRCFELLAGAGVFSPDEPLELHRAQIREAFDENAIAQADSLDLTPLLADPRRKDLTGLEIVTIDDEDTDDRDDALSLEVEQVPSADSPGVFRLGIHITDAAALVPPGSPLDAEADLRMASLYLPERKVPMLPPRLTSGVGSLDPGEARLALSLLVRVDASAEVLDWDLTPSVVRSQAALSYEDVDSVMETDNGRRREALLNLHRLAQAWRRRREDAGAVNIDRPEMDIKLGTSWDVEVGVRLRSSPARVLVAEMMILCNWLLAEFCQKNQVPAGYRRQPPPGPAEPEDAEGLPAGPYAHYKMIGRLRPAQVGLEPGPHGGLGVPAYIQSTSPLRRYPDLVMQRQIGHFLSAGKPRYSPDEIASVMHRADVQIRELAQVEEARKRYWLLKYLQQTRLEASRDPMPAVVLDNNPRRIALLELLEFPFRFRAKLPPTCGAGETVNMALQGIDLWRRVAQFVHAPAST